jgi:hypothetical protein
MVGVLGATATTLLIKVAAVTGYVAVETPHTFLGVTLNK